MREVSIDREIVEGGRRFVSPFLATAAPQLFEVRDCERFDCPDGTNAEGYTYTYDEFGNRWTQSLASGSGPGFEFSYNFDRNNHLTPTVAPTEPATSATTGRATWNMMAWAGTGATMPRAGYSTIAPVQRVPPTPPMARATGCKEL